MQTEVIGIDHIYFAVRDLERSEAFYDKFMPMLGFKKDFKSIDDEPCIHYSCRFYTFSLRPANKHAKEHDPYAPGIHQFCFRVVDQQAIDFIYEKFREFGMSVSEPKLYPEFAEDYYAIYFKDPDGICLEITNYHQQKRQHLEHWH